MKYSLRKNNLTNPASFRPVVDITSVLGLFELSVLIKNKVPTITQYEIMQALNAFKSVSLDQLLTGNALNITNFFSIRPAIRKGKINLNFEIIPECSKCVAKATIAKRMIADAKIKATFSFSGETTEGKTSNTPTVPGTGTFDSCGIPQPGDPDVNVTSLAKIIQIYSMPYGIDNHIHNDSGLIVVGENLVFDPDIPDSGIWIKSANNTSRLQSDIISIDPKTVRVVGEVDFTGGPAGSNSVEHVLWLSRINSLGVQKITNYSGFVRKTNYVTQENNQLFITGSQTEGPLSITEFSGSEDLYDITCYKDIGKIMLVVSDLLGIDESKVIINDDGQDLKVNTKDGIMKLTVNSVNKLSSVLLKYGGFLREIASVGNIFDYLQKFYLSSNSLAYSTGDVWRGGTAGNQSAVLKNNRIIISGRREIAIMQLMISYVDPSGVINYGDLHEFLDPGTVLTGDSHGLVVLNGRYLAIFYSDEGEGFKIFDCGETGTIPVLYSSIDNLCSYLPGVGKSIVYDGRFISIMTKPLPPDYNNQSIMVYNVSGLNIFNEREVVNALGVNRVLSSPNYNDSCNYSEGSLFFLRTSDPDEISNTKMEFVVCKTSTLETLISTCEDIDGMPSSIYSGENDVVVFTYLVGDTFRIRCGKIDSLTINFGNFIDFKSSGASFYRSSVKWIEGGKYTIFIRDDDQNYHAIIPINTDGSNIFSADIYGDFSYDSTGYPPIDLLKVNNEQVAVFTYGRIGSGSFPAREERYLKAYDIIDINPTEIRKGQSIQNSVELNGWICYMISIPNIGDTIEVVLSELTADIDLYVRWNLIPTANEFDCLSAEGGTTTESCEVTSSSDGDILYIGVDGFEAGSYTITVNDI